MSAEMPKMPEPVAWRYMHEGKPIGIHPRTIDRYYRFEGEFIDGEPLYTADQMQVYALEATRQAMERCAEVCDDQEEPAWYGYENPNTFDDGRRACAKAIRALIPNDSGNGNDGGR